MRAVGSSVDPSKKSWNAKERHGRCMEHSVHCATRAFIETVAPTPVHLIKRRLASQHAMDKPEDHEHDEDASDEYGEYGEDGEDGDDGEDVNCNFDPKDLLGKVLTFVNQVRSSPQARKYFRKLCVEENVKPVQLLKWVRTRWASLYDLIARLLDVQPACIKFTLLADVSLEVPDLTHGKSYRI